MNLGIDIGGTKIRAILLDNRNKPVFGFNFLTPKNKNAFLSSLEIEIKKLARKYKISGIGVGLPGIVDKDNGILIKAPHIPFLKNWQAKKFFRKFAKKIEIDNDSRCFTLAEAALGAGKGFKNVVGITIGTGVGGGIFINGKIYYGRNGSAGEFGHAILQIAGIKAQSVDYKFEQLAAKKTFLKYSERSKIIGVGLANIINFLNPEIIVFGGGGIFSGDINLTIVRQTAKEYVLSPKAKKTPIVKGKFGENSPAIGAALLLKTGK